MAQNRSAPIVIYFLLGLLSVDIYGNSGSDYWPVWRGPDGTGTASKGNPPLTWSETENIKWKTKLPGKGFSSPVVWGDKVFFQTSIKTDKKVTDSDLGDAAYVHKFDVVCVDRGTGKILWQRTAREEKPHEKHGRGNSFASYSPVTDGKYVWAGFGSHGLHCYDVDGNGKWSVDLGRMKTDDEIGGASSPVLAGQAVIVVMDHMADSTITAVNKETGKIIWRKGRDEETGWATPVAAEVNGKLQVITSSDNRVRSYDVKTGEVIWECEGQTMNAIPTPVAGFGKVYCTSGFQGNILQAIELGRTGDLTGIDAISWEIKKNTPYISSPVLVGDKIYFCYGRRAAVSCYEAETGKVVFDRQKLEGLKDIYASPVAAKDRIYFVGRDGKTAVIKHSKKFETLAVNTLDDKFDASPAIAGDEIFLKGKTYLYCIAKP